MPVDYLQNSVQLFDSDIWGPSCSAPWLPFHLVSSQAPCSQHHILHFSQKNWWQFLSSSDHLSLLPFASALLSVRMLLQKTLIQSGREQNSYNIILQSWKDCSEPNNIIEDAGSFYCLFALPSSEILICPQIGSFTSQDDCGGSKHHFQEQQYRVVGWQGEGLSFSVFLKGKKHFLLFPSRFLYISLARIGLYAQP